MLLMHRSHVGCGGGHASQHEVNAPEKTQHDERRRGHGQRDSAAETRADTSAVCLSKAPPTPMPRDAARPSVQHAPAQHSVGDVAA